MELALAIVCQALKEIHTIKIEVAAVNVKATMIVMIAWHVCHTNVLIHVLAFAVNQQYAMYRDTIQHVLAHLTYPAIHFSNAVKFHDPLNNLIRVHRLPVVHLQIVVAMLVKRCALVHQDILDHHHNVGQSVLFHPNAHRTEHVSITNALIHVRILVASDPFAVSAITIQFALVHLVSLAIHLHNARQIVSLTYSQIFFISK